MIQNSGVECYSRIGSRGRMGGVSCIQKEEPSQNPRQSKNFIYGRYRSTHDVQFMQRRSSRANSTTHVVQRRDRTQHGEIFQTYRNYELQLQRRIVHEASKLRVTKLFQHTKLLQTYNWRTRVINGPESHELGST